VARWREAILNYFVRRTTSGPVEGLNNKIKLILRQAFGFKNASHHFIQQNRGFVALASRAICGLCRPLPGGRARCSPTLNLPVVTRCALMAMALRCR